MGRSVIRSAYTPLKSVQLKMKLKKETPKVVDICAVIEQTVLVAR